jgi:3-methyladenine DNA glycosylase AlkD
MTITEAEIKLREIRAKLRKSMDGIVSTSMREKGLKYRLNFGVNLPTLRQIANNYDRDAILSEMLWREDVRELKILATLLHPIEDFSEENAHKWCAEIPNQEIREQVCMNLFQNLPCANNLVNKWVLSDNENIRTTAYWLFARLIIIRSEQIPDIDCSSVVRNAMNDLHTSAFFLRQSAVNALKYAGRLSSELSREILGKVKIIADSGIPALQEVYSLLKFELDNN